MTYDATILAEASLKAFYRLNETSGTTATDSSANAFNGTLHGGITLNQAAIAAGLDPCMLFSGPGGNGYISLPSGVQIVAPLSVEVWIKDNSLTQTAYFHSNAAFGIGWNATGNKMHVFGNGGSFDTTNAFSSGIAYYVCLTVDASMNFTGYAGKVGTDSAPSQWGTGNPGGSINYSTQESEIGADVAGGGFYFKGYISSVAIYGKVLSSTQMNTHYTAGLASSMSLVTQAQAKFSVRANLQTQTRSKFLVRLALKTQTEAKFLVRLALKTQAEAKFSVRSNLQTQARSKFLIRAKLGTIARSKFITRLALSSPAWVKFLVNQVIAPPTHFMSATWVTRDMQATWKTRDGKVTWKTRQ